MNDRRQPVRMALAAVALLLAAALSACASIPLSGSVHAGAGIVTNDEQPFAFRPAGPTDGASADDILRGFIAAAVRPQDRYETAREFLTPELAASWNPDAGAVLHESPNLVRDEGNGTYRLAVSVVGQVGRNGGYVEYGDAIESTLTFRIVQVEGQWRIAEAPDGVVLLQQTFQRLYTQRTLYFYDAGFANLVPDVRWFLNGADTPTRIVQALLAGPSPALASPVLASAFPSGTALATDAVRTQSGGEVVVDLDPQVARADITTQRLMKLQLTRSLIGGSVVAVQMQAAGVDLDVPDFSNGGPIVADQIDPRAAVGVEGAFGWVVSGDIVSLDGLSGEVVALQPSAVSLDADAERAAVLGVAGVSLAGTGGSVLVDARTGLVPPVLDSRGFIWSVPAVEPRGLQVFDADAAGSGVTTGWNDLTSIVSIGVSRDGTRLLVYGDAGANPILRVYGVVRDGDGRPTGLSESWFDLVPLAGAPIQATWVDEVTVASLARTDAGDSRVVLQAVGGPTQALSRPDRSVAIVGANGESGLRVLTETGELQALRGAGWQVTARDVLYVANQR